MTITTTVTETTKKELQLDIDLPYYAREDDYSYYMVNEDKSITEVLILDSLVHISLKTEKNTFYSQKLSEIMTKCKRISHDQFMEKMEEARAKMEHAMTAEPLKQAI
jgi:hypothetical protein